MKVINFIRYYWYIPLFVIAAFFWWLFSLKRKNPLAQTLIELEAIEEGRKAKKLVLEKGADFAKETITAEYLDKFAALSGKKKIQALELKDDPEKLSKFLIRAGADNDVN